MRPPLSLLVVSRDSVFATAGVRLCESANLDDLSHRNSRNQYFSRESPFFLQIHRFPVRPKRLVVQ